MTTEDKKYEQVLNVLKKSKPVFRNAEAISDKVIEQLTEEKSKAGLPELIIEYLFGWTYIGWVRRSMIVAAVSIALLFGYQQVLILRKINELSGQRIQNGTLFMTSMKDEVTDKMRIFKISGRKVTDGEISASKEQIDEMIKSINKLQIKYKDIINLIENDPELKKYVENRMKEIEKNKN
jgi:hypothetical protein